MTETSNKEFPEKFSQFLLNRGWIRESDNNFLFDTKQGRDTGELYSLNREREDFYTIYCTSFDDSGYKVGKPTLEAEGCEEIVIDTVEDIVWSNRKF